MGFAQVAEGWIHDNRYTSGAVLIQPCCEQPGMLGEWMRQGCLVQGDETVRCMGGSGRNRRRFAKRTIGAELDSFSGDRCASSGLAAAASEERIYEYVAKKMEWQGERLRCGFARRIREWRWKVNFLAGTAGSDRIAGRTCRYGSRSGS